MSVIDIAAGYISRGWSVVPIPPKSKAPRLDSWQELRISESELPRYFNDKDNVGISLGDASRWLIDVDLDHQLARELADNYLPATGAEFGRDSSRRSHRLYVVTGPVETRQYRLPKEHGKKMIVELRSTGVQTVFPGSVHETGEHITWDIEGEPTKVAPGLLAAAVNTLADEVQKRLAPPAINGHLTVTAPRT